MHYSFVFPTLGLVLSQALFVSAIPIHYEFTPKRDLAEGPGYKLCKQNAIRYNPKYFVCHDNEIICPILDQGSNSHPMKRCGDTCFDERYEGCTNNEIVPSSPKRSWELGYDIAYAKPIQSTPIPTSAAAVAAENEDEAAAQALLKRYSTAFKLDAHTLHKRYKELLSSSSSAARPPTNPKSPPPSTTPLTASSSISTFGSSSSPSSLKTSPSSGPSNLSSSTSSTPKQYTQQYIDEEQRKEDDSYLHIEKRWRRESMKSDYPIVRVKQVWDPRQSSWDEQRQGTVENGWSGVREKLGGEGKVEEQEEEEVDVQTVEEVVGRGGDYIREDSEGGVDQEKGLESEESEAKIEVEAETKNDEEEEDEQNKPLGKRDLNKDKDMDFNESMKLLEKVLAGVYM